MSHAGVTASCAASRRRSRPSAASITARCGWCGGYSALRASRAPRACMPAHTSMARRVASSQAPRSIARTCAACSSDQRLAFAGGASSHSHGRVSRRALCNASSVGRAPPSCIAAVTRTDSAAASFSRVYVAAFMCRGAPQRAQRVTGAPSPAHHAPQPAGHHSAVRGSTQFVREHRAQLQVK